MTYIVACLQLLDHVLISLIRIKHLLLARVEQDLKATELEMAVLNLH